MRGERRVSRHSREWPGKQRSIQVQHVQMALKDFVHLHALRGPPLRQGQGGLLQRRCKYMF